MGCKINMVYKFIPYGAVVSDDTDVVGGSDVTVAVASEVEGTGAGGARKGFRQQSNDWGKGMYWTAWEPYSL